MAKTSPERFSKPAIGLAALLFALIGLSSLAQAPIAVLTALVLASWPLVVVRLARNRDGCLTYPLLVLPMWLLLPVIMLRVGWGHLPLLGGTTDSEKGSNAYFWLVHAFMILALQYRFTHTNDRVSAYKGEKVAVSLFALAPVFAAIYYWLY